MVLVTCRTPTCPELLRVFLLRSSRVALLLLLLHLLLHLLLLQKLALLHLLHNFLRSTHRPIWVGSRLVLVGLLRIWWDRRHCRLFRLLGWLWLIDSFVVVLIRLGLLRLRLLRVEAAGATLTASVSRGENDLTGRAMSQIAGEQDVVAGTLQELQEHVARLAGAIAPKHALVRNVPYDLCSGIG